MVNLKRGKRTFEYIYYGSPIVAFDFDQYLLWVSQSVAHEYHYIYYMNDSWE